MTKRGISPASFTVLIENVSPAHQYSASGVFNTPDGASTPGAALPGAAYSFSFAAAPGAKLSFATMFVQSNDLFYAPASTGIALWDASGTPISGDLTDMIQLWDAGSEVNQAPRQAGADNGAAENGVVQLVNDGFSYPANNSIVRVTITQN